MAIKNSKKFFAYPGMPSDLTSTIAAAAEGYLLRNKRSVQTWPQLPVFGAYIPDTIREAIESSDVVFADITVANYNVYYEIGFAIGRGKIVAPVLNASFANASEKIQQDGVFDNIGYRSYKNSEDLIGILSTPPDNRLLTLYEKELNSDQPLFLMDALIKTDFRNLVAGAVKDSGVFFRSFDPEEIPRFQTVKAITDVTSSSGVIITILAAHIVDAERHNLRSAILAGISHGLGRATLLLKDAPLPAPLPADYRDDVQTITQPSDVVSTVKQFSSQAIYGTQTIQKAGVRAERTSLQRLELGASSAENEFRTLQQYFVETSEFQKTLRGEINVVAGRKGSGKTAIFFRVRDIVREQKNTIVVDLKPESHQLSYFRSELMKTLDAGVLDHTIAAFWYFVILTELLLVLHRDYKFRSKFNDNALSAEARIGRVLGKFGIDQEGDFSIRLKKLGALILIEIEKESSRGKTISAEMITGIVFRAGINEVKSTLIDETTVNTKFLFLFDNLDKGWPADGVDAFDIRMVRLLVENLDKVRRDFLVADRDLNTVVFLRNDVYELMVDDTPDRQKSGHVRIDWTDTTKLRQIIYFRLKASAMKQSAAKGNQNFEQLWNAHFDPIAAGMNSFEYLVKHCAMRPRFLINIVEAAISHAINRQHQKVDEDDCIEAVRLHSLYLMNEFGYEIRDVSKLPANILSALVGLGALVTKDEIISRFVVRRNLSSSDADLGFKLMLWYGLLGVINSSGKTKYIYDFDYNRTRFEAEIQNVDDEPLYELNPGLHVGLVS
ncbi:P-loop ATPase, Sll1717 family [Bosea vaviloviae]|uniref:Uncharacterized protein n=1 Tax=Bosea vaviloviae TaxID=1526658 RepID=A0A1D7TWH5_9HYPH|nr:hypothetical protein [Bosea vaviloviae]AOO79484.1 hypothetical protein BHK69_02340 [Bosea vaviloviae]